MVGIKQASKNPKWVLKLPVPYLKNSRETQKETAAINRAYGNASWAFKLDIEFVQWQTPQGQLRGLTGSFLQPLQLLLTDSTACRTRRATKASGSRISSCQRLCVRKGKPPHASKPLPATAQPNKTNWQHSTKIPPFDWLQSVLASVRNTERQRCIGDNKWIISAPKRVFPIYFSFWCTFSNFRKATNLNSWIQKDSKPIYVKHLRAVSFGRRSKHCSA